jgi:hypothetical protein
MLEALSIPVPDRLPPEIDELSEGREWRDARRFITVNVARDVWLDWNPGETARSENPLFVHAFRNLLRNGAELGLRLDRLREGSASLPEPDATGRNWIPFFERAVERVDTLGFRLWLGSQQFQEYQRGGANGQRSEDSWQWKLSQMADGLFNELGIILPPVSVAADEAVEGTSYRYEWNDLRLPPRRGLPAGKALVNDTPERLALLNLRGDSAVNPADGKACAIVDSSYAGACEQAGLTTWNARGFTILDVSAAIRDAADAFVGRPLVDLYLLRLSEFDRELVQLIDESGGRDFFTQILRGLLAEEISVRDLSKLLNWYLGQRFACPTDQSKYIVFAITNVMLADRNITELGSREFIDHARACLKRHISHKYTRGQNTLIVYLLDPKLEEHIGRVNELGPGERRIVLKAVRDEVASLPPTASTPVILTTMEIRHRFRMAIYPEIGNLAVLSYMELSPDMNIQPIARISADDLSHATFFRMIEDLPDLSATCPEPAISNMPELSAQDRSLFEFLKSNHDRLGQRLYAQFNEGRPPYAYTATTERLVRDVLEALLNGTLSLLATGQTELFDRLISAVAKRTPAARAVVIHLYRMPLDLASATRELLAADASMAGSDATAAHILPLLEHIDAVTRRAARRFIEVSKFVRRIQ